MRLELVVATCIVGDDDRVLLVWHKRHKEWLPPGGHLRPDETPDDAAAREVREETGLEIQLMDQTREIITGIKHQLTTPLFADVHNVGDHDHCCFYYLARPKSRNQSIKLNRNEVEDYRWFARSDLEVERVPTDVKQISRLALTTYDSILKYAPV